MTIPCHEIERVVTLEVDSRRARGDIDRLCVRFDEIAKQLQENNRLLSRSGGMVAGAVIVCNLVWIGAITVWQMVKG